MKRYEDIVLNHVRVARHWIVDADIVQGALHGKIKESEMCMLLEEDAYQKRALLDCFGKHERWRMSCPATWWQHLKLTLRTRWPRLFKRLRVRQRVVEFDSGWVCPDLGVKVAAKHLVIPYVTGPSLFEDEE